jgi:hypothetical protein
MWNVLGIVILIIIGLTVLGMVTEAVSEGVGIIMSLFIFAVIGLISNKEG